MDLLHRLKDIISYTGLSVRAFAMKCNISQTTLDKQIKGLRAVSIETIMSVLFAMPEISAEWLMRGEGVMLINNQPSSAELERINKLSNVVESLQEVIDAKNQSISTLTERIKQLETQINNQ